VASVLFIAPADLGETVLATGALAHLLHEGAAVTVVCDPAARDLFRSIPGLALLRTWDGGADLGFWADLTWTSVARPFDVLLDLRRTAAALVVSAKRRFVRATPQVLQHVVEELGALLDAQRALAPRLWLDADARKTAAEIAADGAALLVLAPGGVDAAKRWPRERFAAVARRLADGALAGARIVVIGAAARDADTTRAVVSSLDADGVAAIDLGQGPDLLAAAALMERATLCIGNDNALTHVAAAMGAPTLTLFGPTDERVRAPYGPRTRTLRGRSFAEAASLAALDAGVAMEDVSIDAVEAAALDLLHAGGLR
jgi:lipopolysaccharide export system permease protein